MKIEIKETMPSWREWMTLRKSAGWSVCSEEEFNIAAEHTLYAISIYSSNTIVAMGRIVGDACLCFYLQDIVVAPQYRDKGIGKIVVNRLLGFVCTKATAEATIGLFSSYQKEAFYQKFGFEVRPNATKGSGMYIEKCEIRSDLISQYPNCIML